MYITLFKTQNLELASARSQFLPAQNPVKAVKNHFFSVNKEAELDD